MKCLLSVCLATSICIGAAVDSALRQASAEAHAMQKGISVEMAPANNAQSWPEADGNDAWVVTVDYRGRLYFGADPTTLEGLKQWMIRHPRKREQKLFIKADARAPYASVEKALDAASTAEFTAPVLLVNQRDGSAKPGTVVPPKGLEVAIDGVNHDANAIVVEVLTSPQESATLTIDHQPVSWESLQDRLRESVESRNEKSVFVKVDSQTPFVQVARVIDACGAVKAKAVLGAATL
jgi:biopolymer transport protein ExbD